LFLADQHKAAGVKIRLSKNNDHDRVSHGVECSQEGDRIIPLKSNRSAGTGTPFLLCPPWLQWCVYHFLGSALRRTGSSLPGAGGLLLL